MKKVFKEFIEGFATDYSEEELRDKEHVANQIRMAADESRAFENTLFEIGVCEMVKRIRKGIKQNGILVRKVDEREAINLLRGSKLRDIHPLVGKEDNPEGLVCIFSTDQNEEVTKFVNLLICNDGDLRITDFY